MSKNKAEMLDELNRRYNKTLSLLTDEKKELKMAKTDSVNIVFCDNGVYIEYDTNDDHKYRHHKKVFTQLEDALEAVSWLWEVEKEEV